MDNRENLVDWFIKGTFFNKNLPNNYIGEEFSLSPTNKEDVLLAVKKAYIDMTPRTIEGLGNAHEIKGFDDAFNNILSDLADDFLNYFKSSPVENENDFEKWHAGVCGKFECEFNEFLKKFHVKNKNGKTSQISYGKAQKIVNMTFKYILL